MDRNTRLCELAYKYGSDKCPQLKKHTYTEYYFDLLEGKRDQVKKVLEIGVGGRGASLYMWQDFFPKAKIFGADIDVSRLINQNRIESIYCDQSNKKDLKRLISKTGPDIDLVVDDGSHVPDHQVISCLTLMPLLKKGATYIIEDVADLSIVDKLKPLYDVEVPQIRQPRKRYDNHLVVVKHKEKELAFFAKPAFPVKPDGHLSRVSSIIRAEQIAEYLGAKLNPTVGYKNDVCIYVKPPYKSKEDLNFEGKPYLDIVDSMGFVEVLKTRPDVGVITLSDWNYQMLKKLLPNKIVNIPQQHCNFERKKRVRKEVKKVGMIGNYKAFDFLPPGIREQLAKNGFEFIELTKFFSRQDIVNFYMNIDIQIVWRPYYDYSQDILVNPLKIVNSSSFGIPTVAYSEKGFEEMGGCYIGVSTLEELMGRLIELKTDHKLYQKISRQGLEKSEEYHIANIAKLYQNLANEDE